MNCVRVTEVTRREAYALHRKYALASTGKLNSGIGGLCWTSGLPWLPSQPSQPSLPSDCIASNHQPCLLIFALLCFCCFSSRKEILWINIVCMDSKVLHGSSRVVVCIGRNESVDANKSFRCTLGKSAMQTHDSDAPRISLTMHDGLPPQTYVTRVLTRNLVSVAFLDTGLSQEGLKSCYRISRAKMKHICMGVCLRYAACSLLLCSHRCISGIVI